MTSAASAPAVAARSISLIVLRSRNGFSRRLYYLNVFSLIEIDALAGRAEHDVALHASGVPLCQIANEHFRVKVFGGRERSSDWEQDAAEIDCHEPGYSRD